MSSRTVRVVALAALLSFGPSFLAAHAAPQLVPPIGSVTQFKIPTANSQPNAITFGPDKAMWFTEFIGNKIGRITSTGAITEFPVPAPGFTPDHIATGPDGNLWFTDSNANQVGRVTPSGVFTLFPITNGEPVGITAGPDGNMWFAESGRGKIAMILTASPNTITEFSLPGGGPPFGITAGPDGNLWYTDQALNTIGRITTSGVATEFPLSGNPGPTEITTGPDGNLWFTEYFGDKIGRISPTSPNTITEFPTPTGGVGPDGITVGSDGDLWFTENFGTNVGRITTDGTITEFPIPIQSGQQIGITLGPDGNLWLVAQQGNRVDRVADAAAGTAYALVHSFSFIGTSTRVRAQGATVQWTFEGPVSHTATDSTGMALFDSGSHVIGSSFSFVFTAAGNYSYHCTIHPTLMNGTVSVPISAPKFGTVGTPFTVTWASASPLPGYVFDGQVKIPGSNTWTTWQSDVTTLSADYIPAVAGTYQFRARLRNTGNATASGYSAPAKVAVT